MTEPLYYDVAVLGAGVAGLACAYRLAKNGRSVILLESAGRVGGVISTVRDGDWLREAGPNSFTNFPPSIVELIREVGLGDRALMRPLRDNDRFVWRDGKLCKVPMGPGELIGSDLLTAGEKWRALRGVFAKYIPPSTDLTLGEYFRPRLGDAVVENLLKPFLSGVYAANADRVSFEATFGRMFNSATKHARLFQVMKGMKSGQKKKGPRSAKSLTSFPDGLQEFPEALARAFVTAGGTLQLEANSSLSKGTTERWALNHAAGSVETPFVICAGSPHQSGPLLRKVCPDQADILEDIPYAPLTVVHVGAREDQFTENRNGFGFLTVEGQGLRALGMIWSDRLFAGRAPTGHRLLTCFYGGERDPEVMGWDGGTLRQQVLKDLTASMGFTGGDIAKFEISRWAKALPIFRVGHMRTIEKLLAGLPEGIRLMGNYLGGVSIPDRIEAATKLASELSNQLNGGATTR